MDFLSNIARALEFVVFPWFVSLYFLAWLRFELFLYLRRDGVYKRGPRDDFKVVSNIRFTIIKLQL